MTDIKEPINTTSDGTFLSVVCEKPPKSVVGQKLGGHSPPRNYPPEYELGGDRAVIIVSALVAIIIEFLHFSVKRQHSFAETTCPF